MAYRGPPVRRIASDVDRLELRLDSSAEAVRRARHEVAAFAERHGLANPRDVALAVSEAATNAVVHAYRSEGDEGDIRVVACARESGLVVVVRDYGVGMSPNPEQPGPRPRAVGDRRDRGRAQHRTPGVRRNPDPHPLRARAPPGRLTPPRRYRCRPRRGGRAVECTGLENRSPCTRTAGSNPAPSAPVRQSLALQGASRQFRMRVVRRDRGQCGTASHGPFGTFVPSPFPRARYSEVSSTSWVRWICGACGSSEGGGSAGLRPPFAARWASSWPWLSRIRVSVVCTWPCPRFRRSRLTPTISGGGRRCQVEPSGWSAASCEAVRLTPPAVRSYRRRAAGSNAGLPMSCRPD